MLRLLLGGPVWWARQWIARAVRRRDADYDELEAGRMTGGRESWVFIGSLVAGGCLAYLVPLALAGGILAYVGIGSSLLSWLSRICIAWAALVMLVPWFGLFMVPDRAPDQAITYRFAQRLGLIALAAAVPTGLVLLSAL